MWSTFIIAGPILLLGGFVWLWWQGVPMLYRDAGIGPDAANARLNAVTTTRAALLAGLVGLGALGTFWLNSRVYRITARTFAVTERGHLTDRYSKAIEQLGNDKLDVRLGGIYALEQIATESPRLRDQATIVEVLSAFTRIHSDQYGSSLIKTFSDDVEFEAYIAKMKKLPVDIQAAITVLGRLPVKEGVGRGDLSATWLTFAELAGANLADVDLSHANLAGAWFMHATLAGAQFAEAEMRSINLIGANLNGANLYRANLADAYLVNANLAKSRLTEANPTGARLMNANLTSAYGLTQAALDGAHGNAGTQLPDGVQRPANWSTSSSSGLSASAEAATALNRARAWLNADN